MNRLYIILVIGFFTQSVFGQKNSDVSIEDIMPRFHHHVIRINITQPNFEHWDEPYILSCHYERHLFKYFTLVGKTGIGYEVNKFGPSTNPYQISYHFYSAIEGRYYFTMRHKIKKMKPLNNFSSPYLGIEQLVITNPILLINQVARNTIQGSAGTFLNIGTQKQIKRLYLQAFFGVRLSGVSFSKYAASAFDSRLKSIHMGVTLGYVLK